ncbi:PspC domain-containing protein [Thalassotalea agarivorans]|uniref:Phage shock protein C (PspC) family protein n=1 Tax=Thalassotalea agarivorans TaxID=349064 RepID=A0A1I0H7M1_THASX|nr:PspC domain-containing protein [Thalassotalea agarivorans]SET78872.1 phage shock protein C (PspC) family protein [Thalassotalea agarivorans]
MKYQRDYGLERTLSKDNLNKKLSGVCAGIARYYDLAPLFVRVLAILALLMFPMATGVAYIVAAALMPNSKHY